MGTKGEVYVRRLTIYMFGETPEYHQQPQPWLAEAKEERGSEREAPSVTGKCFVITSRESPSPPSAVWLAVVESSASASRAVGRQPSSGGKGGQLPGKPAARSPALQQVPVACKDTPTGFTLRSSSPSSELPRPARCRRRVRFLLSFKVFQWIKTSAARFPVGLSGRRLKPQHLRVSKTYLTLFGLAPMGG